MNRRLWKALFRHGVESPMYRYYCENHDHREAKGAYWPQREEDMDSQNF